MTSFCELDSRFSAYILIFWQKIKLKSACPNFLSNSLTKLTGNYLKYIRLKILGILKTNSIKNNQSISKSNLC